MRDAHPPTRQHLPRSSFQPREADADAIAESRERLYSTPLEMMRWREKCLAAERALLRVARASH